MSRRYPKLLQIQLTEAERRDIKALAASRGLTLRQATLQAFQTWTEQLRRPVPAAVAGGGAPATSRQKPAQPKPAPTPGHDARPAQQGASAPSVPGPATGRQIPSAEWLRRAAQVDWSKCPEAECLRGTTRSVWVVRGTLAPLADIFSAVAAGHPLPEIAEIYELTRQQLMAVLQYVATPTKPPASGR